MSLELALTSVKHALLGIIAQKDAHKLSSASTVTAPQGPPHQLCALMELILIALYWDLPLQKTALFAQILFTAT